MAFTFRDLLVNMGIAEGNQPAGCPTWLQSGCPTSPQFMVEADDVTEPKGRSDTCPRVTCQRSCVLSWAPPFEAHCHATFEVLPQSDERQRHGPKLNCKISCNATCHPSNPAFESADLSKALLIKKLRDQLHDAIAYLDEQEKKLGGT